MACALIWVGSAGGAVPNNWIPTRVQHRIAAAYPMLTYGPTWLRSGLRYTGYSHGRKQWSVFFDVAHDDSGITRHWTAWDVSRISPSECQEVTGYTMATFKINGVTVYWWAANGEETAFRCITGRGKPIAITANTAVAADEQLNTPKRRHHAYLLAKTVASAARFPH